jgi:hypothetical protein
MTQQEWNQLTPVQREAWRSLHGTLPKDPTPDEALWQALRSRRRIEITYTDGERVRCYVGLSTGWQPCFLEVKTSRSYGGGPLRLEGISAVRELERRR